MQQQKRSQRRQDRRQPNIYARYIALALSFVLICIVYAVILFVVQFKGWLDPPVTDEKNIREVTVAGLRGEIYDCNGKLLVGNSTSYNLLYEYGAMPYTRKEINAEILALDRAIKQTATNYLAFNNIQSLRFAVLNLVMAIFNLLPFYNFDGGKIIETLFKYKLSL